MKYIQIPIPEGHTASFHEATGKVIFHKIEKSITERVRTVQEAIEELLRRDKEDKEVNTLQYFYHCSLPDHLIAYQELIVIAKALNEDWVADWTNANQTKYSPTFIVSNSSGFRFYDCDDWKTLIDSRICFQSKPLAEYAGRQFESVYKRWLFKQQFI